VRVPVPVRPTVVGAGLAVVALTAVTLVPTVAAGSPWAAAQSPAAETVDVPDAGSTALARTEATAVRDKRAADERARVAAERAEAERLAAERAEAERVAAERAAAERAAAERAAAERAAAERAAAERASRSTRSGDPKSIARGMLAERGQADQFGCLDRLWQKESDWNHRAANPSSGAYGIPQSLPAGKMASAGSDWRTNPATQIRWGLGYISQRYGGPCAAWRHSQAKNWY
jgi:hypothetical protein